MTTDKMAEVRWNFEKYYREWMFPTSLQLNRHIVLDKGPIGNK